MNKNEKLLTEFAVYCVRHPEERFWQALRNWSEQNFILSAKELIFEDSKDSSTSFWKDVKDTFYWNNKSD